VFLQIIGAEEADGDARLWNRNESVADDSGRREAQRETEPGEACRELFEQARGDGKEWKEKSNGGSYGDEGGVLLARGLPGDLWSLVCGGC